MRRPLELGLRAAIAVVHKARARIAAARVDRLFQRVEDEGGAQRGGHPPADDAPRAHIDDEGDLDEPGPGRHVGEVRHPQLMRSRGRKLPIDEIGRSRSVDRPRGRHPGAPADGAGQAPRAHQPAHRAARHVKALAPQLLPDLSWAVHLELLVPDSLDLRLQGVITLRPRGATCGIEPAHAMAVICRRGDPHHRADRLDPIRVPVIVDESDGRLPRRSSSAWAKYADTFRKISLVRFSSRFSRSNSFRRCRSSVVSPARWPRSRSAWRTHLRRVSAVQPNLLAIEPIAAHWDGYSGPCSCTRRIARSRTSGEYRLGRAMGVSSQGIRPPRKPVRFRRRWLSGSSALESCEWLMSTFRCAANGAARSWISPIQVPARDSGRSRSRSGRRRRPATPQPNGDSTGWHASCRMKVSQGRAAV